MNLNPLKKDDNTDALVKALEDANSTDTAATTGTPMPDPAQAPTPAAPAVDDATIAADPQVATAGVTAPADDMPPAPAAPVSTDAPAVEDAPVNKSADADNKPGGLAFSDPDLPSGISSDADAHLPTEGKGDTGELDDVKKSALEQLRPLIEKLDLEPADKFDKYLMMLRASDDPALIKPAFDAAQSIAGEKEKAQALLDIINEINYITASQQS
ncbi:hypothetical protein KC973_01235 [Candidatus Saccharibacteria bacterium]|nr:hypothetical protein [Candidatus Saccharibacteria bacterium]